MVAKIRMYYPSSWMKGGVRQAVTCGTRGKGLGAGGTR
jgi:hypothetical protein